jgi:hypothetical protein
MRKNMAERTIAEGRKRHALTISELFHDGDPAAQWVFSLTALDEDLNVLVKPLREAREQQDIPASLFFYRRLVTMLYEARQQSVEFTDDAVELALSWTDGYPFYIQQLGKHAWNLASTSPIGREDIEAAMPAAQAALDMRIYEVRVQRATDQERRYMRAMAELGGGPYRSGAVAAKLGKTTAAVLMVRQRLLDKGLIYATEDYGYVDFTVPRFAEFMRRHMPYRAPRPVRKRRPK